MIESVGVLIQAGTVVELIGFLVVVGLLIAVLRYFGYLTSGGDTEHETDGDGDDGAFDFTNEEVQQLLQTDEELLETLEEMVEDDLAQPVYEGDEESHYAVLDIWWNQIARGFGYEPPEDDDGGAYLVALATTAAYQEHADRVEEYPAIESNICGTSPFVVEHRSEQTDNVLDERTERTPLED